MPHGTATTTRTESNVDAKHMEKLFFGAHSRIYGIEPAMVLNVEDNGKKLIFSAV